MAAFPTSPRWPARLAAALAAVAVAYGALGAASAASQPERERVADLGALSARDASALRGPGAERLVGALAAVEGARRSTLGLWPRYDDASLEAAGRALAAVAAGAPAGSAASQEARLALGRVLLHRGRDVEAARVLGSVVRQGGYRGPQARRLLDWVRAQDDGAPPAGGGR